MHFSHHMLSSLLFLGEEQLQKVQVHIYIVPSHPHTQKISWEIFKISNTMCISFPIRLCLLRLVISLVTKLTKPLCPEMMTYYSRKQTKKIVNLKEDIGGVSDDPEDSLLASFVHVAFEQSKRIAQKQSFLCTAIQDTVLWDPSTCSQPSSCSLPPNHQSSWT